MATIVRALKYTNDRNESSSLLGLFIYFLNFFQILFNWGLLSLHSLLSYWWTFGSRALIGEPLVPELFLEKLLILEFLLVNLWCSSSFWRRRLCVRLLHCALTRDICVRFRH